KSHCRIFTASPCCLISGPPGARRVLPRLNRSKNSVKKPRPRGLPLSALMRMKTRMQPLNFLQNRVSCPNYHDYGEIRRAFPQEGGIPFYVLIDAGGKIVLAKTGAKDEELRAAISKLGIELPMKDATSTEKPKQPGKDTKK